MSCLRLLVLALSTSLVVAPLSASATQGSDAVALDGRDDVTVVAVVDGSFQPQHWDFHASRMPQALDDDPSNDLPLDQAPDTWLPGFPSTENFASYSSLDLVLDDANPNRTVTSLQNLSAAEWNGMRQSTNSTVNYYWIPGTKVVGALHFGTAKFQGTNDAHGANTSSVAVGNIHGTCPECLVVLITYGGDDREAASNWAMRQPWIDVVTNSYGFSHTGQVRDRMYSGSDEALQRAASERGQTIFYSAGNGLRNDYSVPNTTLFSSQEGPDWIVTVGAISPSGGSYTGAGKPADIASVGRSYPSIGGASVSGTDRTFGGTSNATPVTAGYYARALWWARTQLDGARVQVDGVVARGTALPCADVRPECELGDGVLTAAELRIRLFHGATRTPEGVNPAGFGDAPTGPEEADLMAEGHGSYFGLLNSIEQWEAEFARITGPMDGTGALMPRPDGEQDWMVVDSYCRQEIWGRWDAGYYVPGKTPLPLPSPLWPLRSALTVSCDHLFPPV